MVGPMRYKGQAIVEQLLLSLAMIGQLLVIASIVGSFYE